MTFDSSRFTFDPGRDFLGVVMQQGRVQLDSDWNELVSQVLRRMQAGTLDTMGRAVVPRETPDGFLITVTRGELRIGMGRMYIDGLLVENHGKKDGKKTWGVALAEFKGAEPVDYTAQPYYPDPPALPPTAAASPYLVYLDVWQRDVTYLQYPELVEKAVGIDTTGRLQTIWQVKILQDIGEGATCESVGSTDAWASLTRPSGARLFTSTGTVTGTPDPCQIPPSGGYKGLENQLYRVEIHDGGPMKTATFKWSRDNATVASRISRINPGGQSIVVESVGRDEVLRFSDGDWVEITDDVRELHGDTGVMRRIKLGDGVDIATSTIMLIEPLPEDMFPTDLDGQIVLRPNTRVRRWDQKGQILREDGTVYFDLDSPDREPEVPQGVIPVPDQDTTLFLENGILLHFNRVSEGDFHTGDYWNFAARTADASIEILTDAPPRGIHHHYARLAVVTSTPDTGSPMVSDCRVLWPPPEVGTAHDCSCDRCVTPEGHNNGTATIQHAINGLQKSGGVICLAAGYYQLKDTLSMVNVHTLRIRGRGWSTVLKTENRNIGSVVRVSGSKNIVIEDLSVEGPAPIASPQPMEGEIPPVKLIEVENTEGLDLKSLFLFGQIPDLNTSFQTIGVSLSAFVTRFGMHSCAVLANAGVGTADNKGEFGLYADALTVAHNLFFVGSRSGISLIEAWYGGIICIAHNLIHGSVGSAISIQGVSIPGSNCVIEANALYTSGEGIRAGVDNLHITKNTISRTLQLPNFASGVVIKQEPELGNIHCWISENRISDIGGSGIAILTTVASAIINQNVIERAQSGIVFSGAGNAGKLSIENNYLSDIAVNAGSNSPAVGIQVMVFEKQYADITANVIERFAVNSTSSLPIAAILVLGGGGVCISRNRLTDLGPSTTSTDYIAAVELVVPLESITISENIIVHKKRIAGRGELQPHKCQPIRIAPPLNNRALLGLNIVVPDGTNAFQVLAGTKTLGLLREISGRAVKISGNEIVAHNYERPLVEVGRPGAVNGSIVSFTNNYCMGEPSNEEVQSAIVLRAFAAVISQNSIWTSEPINSIMVFVDSKFTAIGNITTGAIKINGGLLDIPWKQLNVSGS